MPALTAPLQTERLHLRAFTPDDLLDYYAYQRLPQVARYLYRLPLDRESARAALTRIARPTDWDTDGAACTLALERRDRPGVVGEVVLTLTEVRARQAEIGWVLNPEFEGRGYATEAARCLARAAFEQVAVHRLYARLDTENTGSVRICERLGMRREAHLVENDLRPDGTWGSEYVYAALAGDLRSSRP